LSVRHEYASLIDLALGDWSQRFLVRDADVLAKIVAQRAVPFPGRVSFLPLGMRKTDDGVAGAERSESPLVPNHPGIVAFAESLVQCDHPELSNLPRQLLGRTLVVRDLATAREIANQSTGFRCITLQGELLEPDGTLVVGTHHA